VEVCKWCKKCEGTNQLYRQESDGSRHPNGKLCAECWVAFKTPSKKLQKLLDRDRRQMEVPCKSSCVVVRGQKVVTSDAKLMTEWLCAGYTVIGVADTQSGLRQLESIARGLTG
jgi:hypothetical protein